MNYDSMTTEQLKRRKANLEEEIQDAYRDPTLTLKERHELVADLKSILLHTILALHGHAPSNSDGVY